jgi:hypothetical protein
MKRIFVVLAALALAACATATPYQPASDGREGYTERRVEADRVMISFKGNSLTERATVETYLLFRAAELTLEQGYDHFLVVTRDVDRNSRFLSSGGRSNLGFYPHYAWYHPRLGWRPYHDPFWDDQTYREVTRYEATAEILLRRGPKPNEANAFDARQVVENLRSSIQRPTGG